MWQTPKKTGSGKRLLHDSLVVTTAAAVVVVIIGVVDLEFVVGADDSGERIGQRRFHGKIT